MARLQTRRQEFILQRMIDRVVARTDLSDLNDSSVVKHLLAAFARELDEAYFQATRILDLFSIDRAAGEDLDERARDIQPGTLTRLGPQRAIGTVVFSRATDTAVTTIIPIGTAVKTADGLVALTTQQAQIEPGGAPVVPGHGFGRDSQLVSAVMQAPGDEGNVAPNTIVRFVTKPAGVDSVTNLSAFTNGRGAETDDAFRARLKQFVNSLARSTVSALEFTALGIADPTPGSLKQVVFSHVFEDPIERGNVTLYVDDGAGTAETTAAVTGEVVIASALGGEEFLFLDNVPVKREIPPVITSSTRGALDLDVEVYLNPADGKLFFDPPLATGEEITADYTHFTGLIQEVQKVIDGDPADRTNYPGHRAAGVRVRVLSPVVVNHSVTARLTILEGFDRATVIANVETAISRAINNLGISGDVIRHELIEQIMGVDGVYDVELVAPVANIVTLDNEIPRITSASILVE